MVCVPQVTRPQRNTVPITCRAQAGDSTLVGFVCNQKQVFPKSRRQKLVPLILLQVSVQSRYKCLRANQISLCSTFLHMRANSCLCAGYTCFRPNPDQVHLCCLFLCPYNSTSLCEATNALREEPSPLRSPPYTRFVCSGSRRAYGCSYCSAHSATMGTLWKGDSVFLAKNAVAMDPDPSREVLFVAACYLGIMRRSNY